MSFAGPHNVQSQGIPWSSDKGCYGIESAPLIGLEVVIAYIRGITQLNPGDDWQGRMDTR